LGDADGESGGDAGEVSLESHLFFEIGEDALERALAYTRLVIEWPRLLVVRVLFGVSSDVPQAASRSCSRDPRMESPEARTMAA
jgi:hypothetical protein